MTMSHRQTSSRSCVAAVGVLALVAAALDAHLHAAGHRERAGGAAGRQPRARAGGQPERRRHSPAAGPPLRDGVLGQRRRAARHGARRGKDKPAKQEVWFGHEPNLVPSRSRPGASADATRRRRYLPEVASTTTRRPSSSSATSLIGPDWLRRGRSNRPATRPGAIAEYRRVIEQAWPKEQEAKFAQLGQRFYTEEAARLPDPAARSEARRRRDRRRCAPAWSSSAGVPRPITPIAIPLSDTATRQDHRRSRRDRAVRCGWHAAASRRGRGSRRTPAGWSTTRPAADRSPRRCSGSATSTFWTFWKNGYEALSALDDNGDGELRGSGAAPPGDLARREPQRRQRPAKCGRSRDHGIEALSCRFAQGRRDLHSGVVASAGVRFDNGRTRPTYDVILRTAVSVSAPGAAVSSAATPPRRRPTRSGARSRSFAIEHASIKAAERDVCDARLRQRQCRGAAAARSGRTPARRGSSR